jgi:hypothetical protein
MQISSGQIVQGNQIIIDEEREKERQREID